MYFQGVTTVLDVQNSKALSLSLGDGCACCTNTGNPLTSNDVCVALTMILKGTSSGDDPSVATTGSSPSRSMSRKPWTGTTVENDPSEPARTARITSPSWWSSYFRSSFYTYRKQYILHNRYFKVRYEFPFWLLPSDVDTAAAAAAASRGGGVASTRKHEHNTQNE